MARPVTRRGLAASAVCGLATLAACAALPRMVAAQVPDIGPPVAAVTLRISPANDAGFLHDLADFTNRFGFAVAGQPGGPVLDGRPTFLAWFKRQDNVAMLVTDMAAPEKMQAFFYGRKDGTAGDVAADLARDYVAKMASYPAFGAGP